MMVLLVGGPGKGKTEAIECTIRELDSALGCNGRLVEGLIAAFNQAGRKVPRRVSLDAGALAAKPLKLKLEIVQDASIETERTPAGKLLVAELESVRAGNRDGIYLCCVNRGVLDDALIHSIEAGDVETKQLLEAIVQAVSLASKAPSCWPLKGHADIAVWPMDAETLVERAASSSKGPGASILGWATDQAKWLEAGQCAAGAYCPFCSSRKALSASREFDSLLLMLRWFELGSGKRWAFRDLFSLVSFLLAGNGVGKSGAPVDPCGWAADLVEADKSAELGSKPTRENSTALFLLMAAQYQHALFHRWDCASATLLGHDIKELGLKDDNTAVGLHHFIQSRKAGYVPASIDGLLSSFVDLLDPALASPDSKVVLWGAPEGIKLREFDARFSRSVQDGLDFAISHRAVSPIERSLFSRLADLDERLLLPAVRRKRPTAASRMQRYVRDFSSRLLRRSLGARQAIVPDMETFEAFQRVVADADGAGHELLEVAHQVEDLLNSGDRFEVSLTTTFGQPLPPERGRAVLVVSRRNVSPCDVDYTGRPPPALSFLDVGLGESVQPIALTFELFKAVRDLALGLSPASLPRSVLALLDTTRARMAGAIVRERNVQDRPNIIVGDGLEISRQKGRFLSVRRSARP